MRREEGSDSPARYPAKVPRTTELPSCPQYEVVPDPARLERAAAVTDCGPDSPLPGRRALGGFRSMVDRKIWIGGWNVPHHERRDVHRLHCRIRKVRREVVPYRKDDGRLGACACPLVIRSAPSANAKSVIR
jgi:hypothetical protein